MKPNRTRRDLSGLSAKLPQTEVLNENSADFSFCAPAKMFDKMQRENLNAVKAVAKAKKAIVAAAKLTSETYLNGNKIIFAGAGTSGRLGVLEAAECPPTFSVGYDVFDTVMAGGKGAVFKAVEGAEDDFNLGARDFKKKAKKGDILIAIAASGRTPYALGALRAARESGNGTVFVSCSDTADTSDADIFIYLPTGAEVVSGSTRLKAATATKCALNMITTMAMALSGKVYKNLMVDVKASNVKLKDRAARLIAKAAGIEKEEAVALAKKTRYNVKAAIVMAKLKVGFGKAQALLKESGGFLDKIINE